MNTIYDIADAADGLISEAGQYLANNPIAIIAIAFASLGGALLAGFVL